MAACMCVWESGCNGLGMVQCRGCGGDLCICLCGGERDCDGCDACGERTEEIFAEDVADALERRGAVEAHPELKPPPPS